MEMYDKETEMTLRDWVRVIFKYKAVILTTFIAVVVSVYVGLQLRTPVFEAEVKMLVLAKKQVEATYYRDLVDFRKAEIALTQSEIVKSTPVLERVVTSLRLDQRPEDYERQFASPVKIFVADLTFQVNKIFQDLCSLFVPTKPEFTLPGPIRAMESLKKNIKVEAIKDTDLFTIKIRDFDPMAAAAIANVASRSYIIFDMEQQLAELQLKFGDKHLAVTQLQDNINRLTARLSATILPTVEAIGPASVKVIDQAYVPVRPSGKPRLFMYLIALPLGLLLGFVLAFVFEYLDQSFRSPQDIEDTLGIPFLGSIPRRLIRSTGLIKNIAKEGPDTQAYHNLSDQIYLLMKDKKLSSLLLAATEDQEGDAVIVANLGMCLSQKTGYKVLIIDANLRDPAIHKIFKTQLTPGFSDVIEGKVSLPKAVQNVSSNLDILTSGKTALNPITVFSSRILTAVVDLARQEYELILVTSANLHRFKDAVMLSTHFRNVAFIINERKARRQAVKVAMTPFEAKEVNLIGVILNDRTYSIPQVIYDRV